MTVAQTSPKVFRVYNPCRVPTRTFRSNQMRRLVLLLAMSLIAWLTHIYLNWNGFHYPDLYKIYISYQENIVGTEAIIVSGQRFHELSWFVQQVWWAGDFAYEAIVHWYILPATALGSLFFLTIFSIGLREVFGYNLFEHNEQHELLFVEVDPKTLQPIK